MEFLKCVKTKTCRTSQGERKSGFFMLIVEVFRKQLGSLIKFTFGIGLKIELEKAGNYPLICGKLAVWFCSSAPFNQSSSIKLRLFHYLCQTVSKALIIKTNRNAEHRILNTL